MDCFFVVLKCRVCEIFRTFRFSRFLHVSFFKSSTFRFAGFTSVGAGFAAFESAGYALQPVLAFFQNSGYYAAYGRQLDASMMMDAINQSIIIRGFLAPGGHVTWAAISGAALVIAGKALRRFDTSLLTDKRFLRLFIIPVILHAAWDSPMSNIGSSIYLVPIALTVIVWIVVMILINMGLAEVERVTKRQ